MAYTAEEKLARAHFYIMQSQKWIAFAGVIMVGDTVVVDDTPSATSNTACTDGYNVWYARKFLDELSEEEVRFLVLHENMHKVLRHLTMWQHLWREDPIRAMMAADFVVNLMIEDVADPGIKMPAGGLIDRNFAGMDTGEVYRRLPTLPKCSICSGQGAGNGSGTGAQQQCNHPHGFDDHLWHQAGDVSQEEQNHRAEEVDSAVRQGAILAGRVAGDQDRRFEGLLEVPIDWKTVLADFVHNYCRGHDFASFRRPNRKWLQFDICMPTSISETLDTVLFAIDTSGSIQGAALQEFVSAGVSALEQVNPLRTDLLYWDHQVAAHEVYFEGEAHKMLESTKPKGGGGTTPSCITDYMKKHNMTPTCCVILTDAYTGGDWGGKWPCPVLWVIKDNKSAQPTTGAAVHF